MQIDAKGAPEAPDEAAAGVDDALRYSIVQPLETFAQGYTDILGRLDIHGVTRVRVRNSFVKPHAAFKGINVGLMGRDADGKTVRLKSSFIPGRPLILRSASTTTTSGRNR
ncbi:hypothetical protein [Ralstonia solanacearum]|uniref:hypothetical protein n=1 Tax=Ralstonia solanacearum TaxID=305 RepID=UPI001FFD8EB2|nr:hypothetical protein [Ralstonia solanacearum]